MDTNPKENGKEITISTNSTVTVSFLIIIIGAVAWAYTIQSSIANRLAEFSEKMVMTESHLGHIAKEVQELKEIAKASASMPVIEKLIQSAVQSQRQVLDSKIEDLNKRLSRLEK